MFRFRKINIPFIILQQWYCFLWQCFFKVRIFAWKIKEFQASKVCVFIIHVFIYTENGFIGRNLFRVYFAMTQKQCDSALSRILNKQKSPIKFDKKYYLFYSSILVIVNQVCYKMIWFIISSKLIVIEATMKWFFYCIKITVFTINFIRNWSRIIIYEIIQNFIQEVIFAFSSQ